MSDERRLSDDEQELWDAFYVMRRRLDKALDASLARGYGLSNSELEILLALLSVPDKRLRVRELVVVLRWEKSRVSHQLTRMVNRDLVEREACPGDARATNIHLTARGRRVALKALPGHIAVVRSLLIEPLDHVQREGLLDAARQVTAAIDESSLAD